MFDPCADSKDSKPDYMGMHTLSMDSVNIHMRIEGIIHMRIEGVIHMRIEGIM